MHAVCAVCAQESAINHKHTRSGRTNVSASVSFTKLHYHYTTGSEIAALGVELDELVARLEASREDHADAQRVITERNRDLATARGQVREGQGRAD